MVGKGFTVLGVRCMVAEAMAANTVWWRVMEKAGLKLVRTFHQPWPYPVEGDEFGDAEYAPDTANWQQQDQAGNGGSTTDNHSGA